MRRFDVKVTRGDGSKRRFRLLPLILWPLRQMDLTAWVIVIVGVLIVSHGTPHLLISYSCYGRCGAAANHTSCGYFGVQGMRWVHPDQNRCSPVSILPLDW